LENTTAFDVGSQNVHRGLKAAVRIGALAGALVFFCGSAGAQRENSKTSADVAAANSLYNQGMQALDRRDLEGARAAFEKTLQLVPRSPEPHNSLGWVLLAQGKTDAAIAEFKTAVKLKPDFAQAHMNLSRALLQGGDSKGAIVEAQEAVQLLQKVS